MRCSILFVFIYCALIANANRYEVPSELVEGKATKETTAFYAEYNSMDEGACPGTRVPWSRQLAANQATDFTYAKTMGSQYPGFV